MDTFLQIIQAVQSDLTVGDESPLFPLATIKLNINRAKRKAEGLFKWPERKDAKTLNTQATLEYYDMPSVWETDSVWKVVIDGKDYGDPVAFEDYLYEKENSIPSGKERMFSSYERKIFVYPTPTVTGDANMDIYGFKWPDALVEDGDTTIFSYSHPDCNEAIALEAVAICKAKGEQEQQGLFRSAEAKSLLTNAYVKVKQNQAKYEKTQGNWDVPDFFATGNTKTRIGDFNN